jgi:branched-chain amino acid transport system ATP-binding protein
VLEVRGLDARYGDAQALWNITIDVGAAETVCIVGPNGAGKTTLVHAIAGLHPAAAGSITVDGVDIAALPGHKVGAHGVATVPEGRRVFGHMSVRDNLLLGAYRKGARAVHRDTEAQVYQLFPRLAERARQPAGSLSGGEQQMVAIGRALMAKPRLLLLDEPSLGLAPVVVDEVFDALTAITVAGVAVLIVEQDVERALAVSDRGYLLTEGRIGATGTAAQLRDTDEVRRRVLGL